MARQKFRRGDVAILSENSWGGVAPRGSLVEVRSGDMKSGKTMDTSTKWCCVRWNTWHLYMPDTSMEYIGRL